jgi:hypothetical protein
MFASRSWNEANATTGARIMAIVVGVWQVLIGFCLARSKHYENGKGLGVVLMLACIVFSSLFLGSEDVDVVAPPDEDSIWFLNYLILIPVHLLFWIFIAIGGKPKADLGEVRLVRAHWQSGDTCIFWRARLFLSSS